MDLKNLTATGLAEEFRRRHLSPVEVTSHILQEIEKTQGTVNAYRLIDPEAALAQARASEQRWLQDKPLSPLDGVPAGIKDLLHVQGWPTRKGSLATSADPQRQDSPVAARLREWGAVLLGKTNTSEFGWKNLTETALAGDTRNPWGCCGVVMHDPYPVRRAMYRDLQAFRTVPDRIRVCLHSEFQKVR